LADPPTGRISATCNERVKQSIGALCYHYFTHHHDLVVQTEMNARDILWTLPTSSPAIGDFQIRQSNTSLITTCIIHSKPCPNKKLVFYISLNKTSVHETCLN
jgi:hypothetical protein